MSQCGVTLLLLLTMSHAVAQSPVPRSATLERIATGFQFVEGPVWKDGAGLLFSDIPANTVYAWTASAGTQPYVSPSGNSNGLTLDSQGRLILTQTGLRRVARRESNGVETSLASAYGGKKLNSPNDVVVKSDGSVWFTDPPLNIPNGQKAELTFSGIFRISVSGALQLLDSSLSQPNGICFSPDEKRLYVNNSAERVIYVWDVVQDTLISNRRRFASMNPAGYADGMKVDSLGNLFSAGPFGIWVFGPDGALLDTILVPGQTSNCNWGDPDRRTLYITSGNSVYRIRLAGTSGVGERGDNLPGGFDLYQNYPNPFNPSTTIRFALPHRTSMTLVVFNALGQQVATLLEGHQAAGAHDLKFDGSRLASGLYFYRMQAGEFTQTRSLLLVR
ncbi:MAG TPA: SMP-30/gluconolactonase/LRE family protein [Bacteroidota bacterium]